jgi:hypothetical protein
MSEGPRFYRNLAITPILAQALGFSDTEPARFGDSLIPPKEVFAIRVVSVRSIL